MAKVIVGGAAKEAKVKVYLNGAWKDADRKVFKNGIWHPFWDGELYKFGNEYTDITGGWVVGNVPPPGWNKYNSATLTKNAANMVLKGRLNTLYSGKKIDVTNYKTMVFKGSVNKWSTIRVKPTKDSQENGAYGDWSVGQTERRVDISSLTGEHYVCLSIYDSDNSTITLTEVYME